MSKTPKFDLFRAKVNIGRLVCWITRKHRRGKRFGNPVLQSDGKLHQMFECTRCGTTWMSKIKVKL